VVGEPDDLDVAALTPVEVDPAFVAAVEDALSGPASAVALDPNRTLGADPHDFAGLYIRHRSSFAAHARRFLRDSRDVDEVVQEAFLRLFLALPELGSELQALAYCRRTVTNLCIDRYRADKRRPRLVNIESVPQNDFAEEELDDPVVQAEDAAFVREALSLLTPLHRDALVKREIEEKSIPVIAEELGVPEDSVKHLLHRARRALRRHLAKTHLAPGADLDDVSTLSLLAKSAAAGGGRLGVAVLFITAAVLGARPDLPATALTSWPLHDLLPAMTRVLSPGSADAPAAPSVSKHVVKPAPHQSVGRTPTDLAVPDKSAAVAPIAPKPSAETLALPQTSAAPKTSPLAAPATPTPDADASPNVSASPSPSSSPSPSASPSPTGSPTPSAKPSSDPRQAHIETSPTASPTAAASASLAP